MKYGVLISGFLFFALFSCEDSDSPCLSRTGDELTEFRQLEYFNHMVIDDIFDVVLVEDTLTGIEITAGDGLMELVETMVDENSALIVSNDAGCRWSREYGRIKLRVHYTNLDSIFINSPVHLSNEGVFQGNILKIRVFARLAETDLHLDCHRFELLCDYRTYGDYYVTGECFHAILASDGASMFYCEDLVCQWGDIVTFRLGDIYINAQQKLNYGIYSSGSIYYHGSPVFTIKGHDGNGKLVSLDE
jgi:hypothetical protein